MTQFDSATSNTNEQCLGTCKTPQGCSCGRVARLLAERTTSQHSTTRSTTNSSPNTKTECVSSELPSTKPSGTPSSSQSSVAENQTSATTTTGSAPSSESQPKAGEIIPFVGTKSNPSAPKNAKETGGSKKGKTVTVSAAKTRATAKIGGKALKKDPLPPLIGDLDRLVEMLTYVRPAGSYGEEAFIDMYLKPLVDEAGDKGEVDGYGNLFITVGENPTTMFTAHTDTMHVDTDTSNFTDLFAPGGLFAGMDPNEFLDDDELGNDPTVVNIFQPINYDSTHGILWKDDGDCLGADDGTGIWLMVNMIEAKVPGFYAFFRAEECGRLGSKDYLKNHKDHLEAMNLKHCISFDRKGKNDVITRQRGTECCSNAFAKKLSAALSEHEHLTYAPCPNGSFTDSATFDHLIPECTNLAVGYLDQHTSREIQSLHHAHYLLEQLLKVNWEALPAERDPKKRPMFDHYGGGYGSGYGGYNGYSGGYNSYNINSAPVGVHSWAMTRLLDAYPYRVADALEKLGITTEDLINEMWPTPGGKH